jgi:hypothetical protein
MRTKDVIRNRPDPTGVVSQEFKVLTVMKNLHSTLNDFYVSCPWYV